MATVTTKLLKSPQIGDTSHLSMWIALLFISGGAVIGTAGTEKKKAEMKPEYRHTYGPGAAVCASLVLKKTKIYMLKNRATVSSS